MLRELKEGGRGNHDKLGSFFFFFGSPTSHRLSRANHPRLLILGGPPWPQSIAPTRHRYHCRLPLMPHTSAYFLLLTYCFIIFAGFLVLLAILSGEPQARSKVAFHPDRWSFGFFFFCSVYICLEALKACIFDSLLYLGIGALVHFWFFWGTGRACSFSQRCWCYTIQGWSLGWFWGTEYTTPLAREMGGFGGWRWTGK